MLISPTWRKKMEQTTTIQLGACKSGSQGAGAPLPTYNEIESQLACQQPPGGQLICLSINQLNGSSKLMDESGMSLAAAARWRDKGLADLPITPAAAADLVAAHKLVATPSGGCPSGAPLGGCILGQATNLLRQLAVFGHPAHQCNRSGRRLSRSEPVGACSRA